MYSVAFEPSHLFSKHSHVFIIEIKNILFQLRVCRNLPHDLTKFGQQNAYIKLMTTNLNISANLR